MSNRKHITVTGDRFSEKELLFLKWIRDGYPPAAAAAKAGYASPSSTARSLLTRPVMQDELARIQVEIAESMHVSRITVFQMLRDSFDMAVMKEEAGSMVRVAAEINKMCGYYNQTSQSEDVGRHLIEATQTNPFTEATTEQLEDLADFGDID